LSKVIKIHIKKLDTRDRNNQFKTLRNYMYVNPQEVFVRKDGITVDLIEEQKHQNNLVHFLYLIQWCIPTRGSFSPQK
jgi:hypothetical protein